MKTTITLTKEEVLRCISVASYGSEGGDLALRLPFGGHGFGREELASAKVQRLTGDVPGQDTDDFELILEFVSGEGRDTNAA